ncbi:MAG TPA: hypothetical protein VKA94_05025 [Hyphomicrobiales bacterium]|nr:hypothetical protein [Hyphomicrobiales bacterium]
MEPERYFLDCDQDRHWYVIPLSRRVEWLNWNSQDPADEKFWTVPDFAKQVCGSHTLVTFENPVIE